MASNPLVSSADRLVAVENLRKQFGARTVVEALSVSVTTGQAFGLVGANGGGKTTALRMLAGLLRPDSGSGTVLGFDLLREGHKVRTRIGYMSQGMSLYPTLTVLENLRFRAEVFAVEQPRQAARVIARKFGLESSLNLPAGSLSGGWLRMLQMAAALIHRPQLVLLDEPTAGLDAANRQAVWGRIMEQASNGVGILLSTHDLSDAVRCAQVVLVSSGVVTAAGTPDEVIAVAPAAAFLLVAGQTQSLVGQLSAMRGVVACYPYGQNLRVLVDIESLEVFQRAMQQRGQQPLRTALTFEDATLMLSRTDPGARA